MTNCISNQARDVRPHPSARGGLPASATGRRWIWATLAGVPALMAVTIAVPGLLLADRLPGGLGDNGVYQALAWGALAAVAFGILFRQQRRRGAAAPAATWGWTVPVVYMLGGAMVSTRLFSLAVNLDQAQRVESGGWEGFVSYGSMTLGAVVGALLARRVAVHLPRATLPAARAAWVESIPVGWPYVILNGGVVVAMVVLMTWIGGSLPFAVAAGMWMVAFYVWVTSARVAFTPTGVRVTRGAFGLAAVTRVLPIADIDGVEIVRVSVREIVHAAAVDTGTSNFAFRPGPALRVRVRSRKPVLISMRSAAQAHEAAALLAGWRPDAAARVS